MTPKELFMELNDKGNIPIVVWDEENAEYYEITGSRVEHEFYQTTGLDHSEGQVIILEY